MRTWTPVAEGLYLWRDTCRVYALLDGPRALLFDLGSGEGLDALGQLGVEQVGGVWFTHAHRDQCQGWSAAVAAGASLHFPAGARAVLDPAVRDDFRRVAPGYLAYPNQFHAPPPIPPALFDVVPGRFEFGPWDITVHAAPGHCPHQVAYLLEGPGGASLIAGDALHSAGRVHETFCLDHDHYTGAGARVAADTLAALRNLRPDRLCPAHGPVIDEVQTACTLTLDRLRRLADLKDTHVPGRAADRRLIRPRPDTMIPLSEHLWVWNNSYLLVSDAGPVLLVDAQTRELDGFLAAYRAALGERPLEVVLLTHIHCDHVLGAEPLRQRWPLAVWAHESLVDPLARPLAYPRPWLAGTPTRVDRPLAEGAVVRWREYELTAYWCPGQTDLHAAYALTVDGRRVVFAGDNFYPAQQWGGTGGLCGYNGGRPELWRRSARLLLELAPEWLLASHLQPFVWAPDYFEAVLNWCDEVSRALRELAPDGLLGRHSDPHLLTACPHVQPAGPALPVTLSVRNPSPRAQRVTLEPVLPEGLRGGPARVSLTVPPEATAEAQFTLAADTDLTGMRLVAWDVTVDGERWGEVVGAYVRGHGRYLGQEP